MKRISKFLVLFMVVCSFCTVALFASDDIKQSETTVGLDLTDLGYFRIWFEDTAHGAYPDIIDMEKNNTSGATSSYYVYFLLNYEIISKDSVTIKLASNGALSYKGAEEGDMVDYWVDGFLAGGEDPVKFGVQNGATYGNTYSDGASVTVTNTDSKTYHYSVQVANDMAGRYKVYTTTLTATVTVNN